MKRLGVIGFPVAHSRSPAMHTAALAELGLSEEWSYEALEIEPAALPERLAALAGEGFVGLNVTIPHKQEALMRSDAASERAVAIGAANTLSLLDGRITAENTDAPGLIAALGPEEAGRQALVIGAGGSARAMVWALMHFGCPVTIWNRTEARAASLATQFGATAAPLGKPPPVANFEIVINATSVGLGDSEGQLDKLGINPEDIGSKTVVELPYGEADTELVREARDRGSRVIDGLEILVRQGAESLRIWTGAEAPLDVMRQAARG